MDIGYINPYSPTASYSMYYDEAVRAERRDRIEESDEQREEERYQEDVRRARREEIEDEERGRNIDEEA